MKTNGRGRGRTFFEREESAADLVDRQFGLDIAGGELN